MSLSSRNNFYYLKCFFFHPQSKTLLKFVQCGVPLESREAWSLFDLLLKDKSTEVSSQSSQTWQEIANVVAIFRQFGAKEQVCTCEYVHTVHATSRDQNDRIGRSE